MRIRMELDQVNNLIEKLLQFSRDLFSSSEAIKLSNEPTSWQGDVAEVFREQLNNLCGSINKNAEDAVKLYLNLNFERDQWVDVDNHGVLRIGKIQEEPQPDQNYPIGLRIGITIGKIIDRFEDITYNKKLNEFTQRWQTLTLDERKKYLQDLQHRMADKHGMPRMLLVVEDLPDGNGDLKGVNLDKILVIDSDNMLSDDPWRVMETLFHETRHQYQREVVNNYTEMGQIPEGLSKKKIEKWISEFNNYINGEDDFRGYYNQDIEKDARDYGDTLMKEVLDDIENLYSQSGSGGSSW